MSELKSSGEQKTLEFSLTPDEFDLLLSMAGVATGFMMAQGKKRLAYSFVRLVNRLNENNPDFTPYTIPRDAELDADSKTSDK